VSADGPAAPEFSTLSLHDALPISKFSSTRPIGSVILWQPPHTGFSLCACRRSRAVRRRGSGFSNAEKSTFAGGGGTRWHNRRSRSEEHTSELQSRENLVCRLLLEK